jgi:hypothetical protein
MPATPVFMTNQLIASMHPKIADSEIIFNG